MTDVPTVGRAGVAVQLSLTDALPLELLAAVVAGEQAGVDAFHVDVTDGRFVPDFMHGLRTVQALADRRTLPVEVHLMVEEPERWIEPVVRAGAARVAFHAEATHYPLRCAALCRTAGGSPTLAVNPATPTEPLAYAMAAVDRVNLLTSEPDDVGARFLPGLLDKIAATAGIVPDGVRLQVDGGVGAAEAPALVDRGVLDLVMGRALVDVPSMPDVLRDVTSGPPTGGRDPQTSTPERERADQ